MQTLFLIITFINLCIFGFGLLSLVKDTFFTNVTEIFIHRNGFFLSTVFVVNTAMLYVAGLTTTFSIGLCITLLCISILTLTLLCLYTHGVYKGDLK